MRQTARIAGGRSLMARNAGAPLVYQPTMLDVLIAKAWRFCVSLAKQLCIVFASVALDHSAKAIKKKGSDKIQSVLTGKTEEDNERTEYNRNKLYGGNSGYDKYDRYDQLNNSYQNDIPFKSYS